MSSTRIFFHKIHFVFALISLLISTLGILGWILRDPTLIQINSEMAPMVFNTAACLFILSLGFLFSEGRSAIISRVCALLVIILAGATLLQFLLGVELGIDNIFVDPVYGNNVRILGKMSLSTALSFLILGLLIYLRRPSFSYMMAAVTGASLVVGTGLIALFSYMVGFNPEYGWGSFSRMALHTSTCVLLLSLGCLWQIRMEIRKESVRRSAFIPFMVVIVGVLTSMAIWHALVLRDQERNKSIVQIRSDSLTSNLDNIFLPLEKALEHMARRFASGSYKAEDTWIVDAKSYYEDFEGLTRLVWSDEDNIARWVYPMSNGGERVVNMNVAIHDREVRERLNKAVAENQAFLSRVFELRTGGKGFVLLVPIIKDGRFRGALSAALKVEPFFSRVAHAEGYNLTILEDGREIYSTAKPDPSFARDWKVVTPYRTLGVNWDIIMTPTPAIIRANTSALPGVVLVFGVSVSLLLGVTLHFYTRTRDSERAAHEAYEWKQAGMNSVPLLIISMDENTIIREMNAAAERLLEYSSAEVAGKTNPTLFCDASETQDVREEMEKILQRPITLGRDYMDCFFELGYNKASEWTLISKSGKRYTAILSVSAIRDSQEKITGYLAILEDVTELKSKERLLKEQETKILASSRLASLGEMAAGIAHEINNPLAIINGHVGVLRRMLSQKGVQDAEVAKKIEAIESVIHRIAKIIRGLRSYAREQDLGANERVKVEALVEDTLAFCHEKFRTEGVHLETFLQPQLFISCRPYQIAQVLLNLLNNALDAVSSSRLKKVTIEGRARDQGVEIAVSDTGPGIPFHLREKIMEPFFTTKEVGKGVGLGLSISQGIIQAHNGKFYLDNNSAKTRFVIWVPDEETVSKDSKPSPLAE